MRKRLGLVLVACLGLALPAAAQFRGSDATPFEIGGGYAYRSFNAQTTPNNTGDPATEPHVPMNGWFATVGYNFGSLFGVVTDLDWTRANVPNNVGLPGVNTFSSVMVGPQIYPLGHHRITPFAHVEFGLVHNADNISNTPFLEGENEGACGTVSSGVACTFTDGSFGIAAGGGVDFSLTHNLAVRLAQFDWEQSRMFEPGAATGNSNQNNWKVKAGVIVRF
jgi:opacity protein-like surface antigen